MPCYDSYSSVEVASLCTTGYGLDASSLVILTFPPYRTALYHRYEPEPPSPSKTKPTSSSLSSSSSFSSTSSECLREDNSNPRPWWKNVKKIGSYPRSVVRRIKQRLH